MNNYTIKDINEKVLSVSENETNKEYELTFETPDKTDKIQLSGQGSIKVSVSV